MVRDEIAINNERLKLLAGFLNAVGVGTIGIGALGPSLAFLGTSSGDAGPSIPHPLLWAASVLGGLALHLLAHYVLGGIKRATP